MDPYKDYKINDHKIKDHKINDQILKRVSSYKNINMQSYEDFILENPQLISHTSDIPAVYYSCTFSKPKKRLFTFTVNGDISYSALSSLLYTSESQISFFNIKNFVICNAEDEKLRDYITKIFSMRGISFIDHTVLLKNLINNDLLDIIFFTNREFYKIKIKRVIKMYGNIEGYFKYTNVESRDLKCHLCKKNNFEVELNKDFIIREKFNRFCKKCIKIVNKKTRT